LLIINVLAQQPQGQLQKQHNLLSEKNKKVQKVTKLITNIIPKLKLN